MKRVKDARMDNLSNRICTHRADDSLLRDRIQTEWEKEEMKDLLDIIRICAMSRTFWVIVVLFWFHVRLSRLEEQAKRLRLRNRNA